MSALTAPPRGKRRTVLLTLLYLLGLPFILLSQRYLTLSCDSIVICHYRAVAGAACLLLLAALVDRQGLAALLGNRRALAWVCAMGVLAGGGSLLILESMRHAGVLASSLVGVLGLPAVTVISMALFQDERPAKMGRLACGIALATAGAGGYAWAGQAFAVGNHFVLGVFLRLAAVGTGCILAPLAKHVIHRQSALAVGGLMQGVAGLGFLAAGLAVDVYRSPLDLGATTLTWMVLSGAGGTLVGVGLGMVLLKRIGVVRRGVINLSLPILVGIAAYVLFGEQVAPAQLPCIAVLLAGCGCVMAAGRSAPPAPASA